uniref:F-box domain-containing protein n=1 Tax=Globodera pallida TaxID=36090 RepID=A0A183C5X5_GLOPA
MADQPRVKQRRMNQIQIANDVWLNIFPFLGSDQRIRKLSLISCRFDGLVGIYFKKRTTWALGDLEIRRSMDVLSAQFVNHRDERAPIPQGAPPDGMIGFKRIDIRYIDHTVIDFLHRIQHLLINNAGQHISVALEIASSEKLSWRVVSRHIWPLFASNIGTLRLVVDDPLGLCMLRKYMSPTVLRNSAALQLLSVDTFFMHRFAPLGDRGGATESQAVSMWLHTPRADGRPKVFQFTTWFYNSQQMVDGLKEIFLSPSAAAANAATPAVAVSFIIVMRFRLFHKAVVEPVPFVLDNERTGERLALRRVQDKMWLIERSPIGTDAKQWTEWTREALGEDTRDQPQQPQNSVINVHVADRVIGFVQP